MLALLLTVLATSAPAFAAPCCGSTAATPTLITGDDRIQLSGSVAYGQVIGDATAAGTASFRADSESERTQTFKLEGAYLISDRWQAGASVPILRRERDARVSGSSSTGVGDLGFSAAYEALPEWEYSAWKPRGFVFAQALVPTGGSIHQVSYELTDRWGLNARGRGFYTLGGGALLIKAWSNWDASFLAETHRAFARTFSQPGADGMRLEPGWGFTAALAAGYSPDSLPLRFGLALSPVYEAGVRAVGEGIDSRSSAQLVWNTSAQLSWMINRSNSLAAIYTDQTLLGPARNVSLSATLALLYQRRWER